MVAYEVLHSMKTKPKGKTVSIALKLDMSKPYDRIKWSYLEVMIKKKKN